MDPNRARAAPSERGSDQARPGVPTSSGCRDSPSTWRAGRPARPDDLGHLARGAKSTCSTPPEPTTHRRSTPNARDRDREVRRRRGPAIRHVGDGQDRGRGAQGRALRSPSPLARAWWRRYRSRSLRPEPVAQERQSTPNAHIPVEIARQAGNRRAMDDHRTHGKHPQSRWRHGGRELPGLNFEPQDDAEQEAVLRSASTPYGSSIELPILVRSAGPGLIP
jgi:hypothetical protein